MKVGDLVTLSTYALNSEPMWNLKQKVMKHKKPLVGLVVRVKDNPWTYSWTSANEKKFYYVKWVQDYGPASRRSARAGHHHGDAYVKENAYFLRKDLKFVKGSK